jgi:CRISPR-associated protein Csm4
MSRKKFDVIKLYFDSPLHISRGQTNSYDVSEQVIHSDTLKAALFVMAKQLQDEEMDEDDEAFHQRFRISSAFPFKGDELFFPKPMIQLPIQNPEEDETKISKTLKKVQYIGKEIFEQVLNGQNIRISSDQLLSNAKFLHSKVASGDMTLMKSDVQQKVYIPEDPAEDSWPYYIDRIYFARDSGLFFLLNTEDETIKKTVLNCLNLLADTGIGSDRNMGNGTFSYTTETVELELPDESSYETNLSLYLPQREELNKKDIEQSSYHLIKRGGYIAGTNNPEFLSLRKRNVYMMMEGSVFPFYSGRTGKIENLKPDYEGIHNIWRDGRSIFLPIKITVS